MLDTATKTALDALKTASKNVVHKIADKYVKPKPVPEANSRNVDEIIVSPQRREEMLNKIRQVL